MSSEDPLRRVTLSRTGRLMFRATNERGVTIEMGAGEGDAFSPVELLLAAIAGCTAMDVDAITGKRAEAERLDVVGEGRKVRDGDGNHLVDLAVDFSVSFPAGEGGDAARSVLTTAIKRSHDRLCTVSRTVELASPVAVRLDGTSMDGTGAGATGRDGTGPDRTGPGETGRGE